MAAESLAAAAVRGATFDPILRIDEVAEITGVPIATLRWWRNRNKGEGPKSGRVGRRVAYRASDVRAWIDAQFVDEPAAEPEGPHLRSV